MDERTVDLEILDAGLDDMVALVYIWQIVARVEELDCGDREAAIAPTLAAVRRLLEAELVIAGDVVTGAEGLLEVRSWESTSAETVARIEAEWREDREGDQIPDWLVWLELTDRGRAVAQGRRDREDGRSV